MKEVLDLEGGVVMVSEYTSLLYEIDRVYMYIHQRGMLYMDLLYSTLSSTVSSSLLFHSGLLYGRDCCHC
jgi:hypothetical protein